MSNMRVVDLTAEARAEQIRTRLAINPMVEQRAEYVRKRYEISPTDAEISLRVRAKFPIISIVSYEERRVFGQLERIRQDIIDRRSAKHRQALSQLATELETVEIQDEFDAKMEEGVRLKQEIERIADSHQIVVWFYSDGVVHWSRYEQDPVTKEIRHAPRPLNINSLANQRIDPNNPVLVMRSLFDPPEKAVDGVDFRTALIVFCDLHPWLDREDRAGRFNHMLVRAMRDLVFKIRFAPEPRSIFILSPRMVVPFELRKDLQVIDYPLPDLAQLTAYFNSLKPGLTNHYGGVESNWNHLAEGEERRLITALSGLTYGEAENVIAKSLVENGCLESKDIGAALTEKRQIVEKEGILEYYESDTDLTRVGGLEKLKAWLGERHDAFRGEPIELKCKTETITVTLPVPKGILLIGVPGGGKSLVAKAIASTWGLPLLRLDIGRVYGGIVGQSEENMRRAIQVAESVSPSVLWLDEVEKAFPSSSGAQDAGTSLRVMNTFLTWLQEKKRPVFVVATGNNISQLPPELTRKGRFDEIFYVGLPNLEARKAIFQVHTKGLPLSENQIAILAHAAIYFTGAEIEQVVKNATLSWTRAMRFMDDPDLEQVSDMLIDRINEHIKNFNPLSKREAGNGTGILEMMLKHAEMLALPADTFEQLPSVGMSNKRNWSESDGRISRW